MRNAFAVNPGRRVHRSTCALVALLIIASHAGSAVAQATTSAGAGRIDSLIRAMTLDEKLTFLHGARDPQPAVGLNSAGYMAGVPRLGIPPLRLTDGPAGIRTSAPATALAAPVALAASFDTALARTYGAVIGRDGLARNQDVLLSPMVNIVRVPQAGRNFETLGEDPLLASVMVAPEIEGIQGAGLIATVKHYAANNFERGRQGVDAVVDERTLHEIYLPAFESAVRAGAGSVMCSYNKLNGIQACANRDLLTEILRKQFGFTGWVMTDWFAFHDLGALQAGLDQEMPGLSLRGPPRSLFFADTLRAAVQAGRIPESSVDTAVARILRQMDRFGLLAATPRNRPGLDAVADSSAAVRVATEGAVLLRNERATLPIGGKELSRIVVIGPTARTPLVGGGGSARVLPMHTTSLLAALAHRAGADVRYLPGIDLDGEAVPASALTQSVNGAPGLSRSAEGQPQSQTDSRIDFTGAHALPAGTSWTWTGVLTAPSSGVYDIRLQTSGGRGSMTLVPAPNDTLRLGGGLFGGQSLLPTTDGLGNTVITARLGAGQRVALRVEADGRPSPFAGLAGGRGERPLQVRLAWSTPERRERFVQDAVVAARGAGRVVIMAHDEGTEGADRPSLALPANQDALIDAVSRANPRTVVVLNTGSAVVMPWLSHTGAVLEMWYAGQEGGEATARLLTGEANPAGRLPVTFPARLADTPTADSSRYPGIAGEAKYDEGILVGYRWYDAKHIAPLFAFGHGLSYTRFAYSNLAVRPSGDGYDVSFDVRNVGARAGAEVPQVYLGAPSASGVSFAPRQLVGFARVDLAPGTRRAVTVHVDRRALSYWSPTQHGWTMASGSRKVWVGASSRDVRLYGTLGGR